MSFDLHRQLQMRYAGDRGACEVEIEGGFVADVLRDGVIHEVQTRAIGRIRGKIRSILDAWPVVVVLPVARNTVIVYCAGEPPVEYARRVSPKHGKPLDGFVEAVSLAKLLAHPNLSLEIVLADVNEYRVRRSEAELALMQRRRKRRRMRPPHWATINRRLAAVVETIRLDTPADGLRLLPKSLPFPFTTKMLADAAGLSRWHAAQAAYTLRHMQAIVPVRRTREGVWYTRAIAGGAGRPPRRTGRLKDGQ